MALNLKDARLGALDRCRAVHARPLAHGGEVMRSLLWGLVWLVAYTVDVLLLTVIVYAVGRYVFGFWS